MSNKRSSTLWMLVKSLTRSEKRYFKLSFAGAENKKYLKLFELIDAQKVFDEDKILASDREFKPSQFSNLKAHLYAKILKSLRDFSLSTIPSLQIREWIDEAQILFNKSLYQQSGQRLNKAFKLASETDNLELQLEILKWKKKIVTHTVGWGNKGYVDEIIQDVQTVNEQINNINRFSNLQSQLQSLYQKNGYIRNEKEFRKIEEIFHSNLPLVDEGNMTVTERIHFYQLHIGYNFFIQDFQAGHDYAKKWVEVFRENKTMAKAQLELYITGLNYFLIAQYKLLKYNDFQETKRELRALNRLPKSVYNDNIRLKLLKYTFVHEFNSLFLSGDFDRGVELIERLSSGLEGFIDQLDAHSRVILFYKTACLYFGNSDFKKSIFWLNQVIDSKEVELREDIHGFARIMLLVSNYELDNIELIQYYIRSTYRFLFKTKDLHQFQKLILSFLKGLNPHLAENEVINRFESLRRKMLELRNNPYESRAFVYFDIISWLESKIERRSIMEVIKKKSDLIRNEKSMADAML